MINSKYLYEQANRIVKKAGTRNPINVARELGIEIYWHDNLEDLLGLFTVIKKKRAIVLNNRLEEYMLRMVMTHEIGHDTLHRDLAKNSTFQEFVLFDIKSQAAYEANIFASHLLIDTD